MATVDKTKTQPTNEAKPVNAERKEEIKKAIPLFEPIFNITKQGLEKDRAQLTVNMWESYLKQQPINQKLIKLDIKEAKEFIKTQASTAKPEEKGRPSVAVIGAGCSGLMAALHLQSKCDVTILEASGRVGGRVQTHHFSGEKSDYAELGAMRIPTAHKYVNEFLEDKDLFSPDEIQQFKMKSVPENQRFYFVNGQRMTIEEGDSHPTRLKYPGVRSTADKLWDEATKDITALYRNDPAECVRQYDRYSLREFLKYKAQVPIVMAGMDAEGGFGSGGSAGSGAGGGEGKSTNATNATNNTNTINTTATAEAVLAADRLFKGPGQEFLSVSGFASTTHENIPGKRPLTEAEIEAIAVILNTETSMSLSLIESIRDQADINPDVTYRYVYGGNDLLPTRMWTKLLRCRTKLNCAVTRINTTGPKAAVYHTGASLPELFDFVIVSVPFTKARFIHFEPQLSRCKRLAIREMHYDDAVKILLRFKYRWWEDPEQPGGQNVYGGYSVTDLPSHYCYYPSYGTNAEGGGIVLAAYVWGDDARKFNGIGEEASVQAALSDLIRIHGEHRRDIITSTFMNGKMHSWAMDPYANGAFAMYMPGQQALFQRDVTSMEGDGKILWAGEHTSLKHAWIEGALESGLRAAKQILYEPTDLLVIGGGAVGLAAAYAATQQAQYKKITVVEKFDLRNQQGSSPGFSRMWREMHSETELAKLAIKAEKLWDDLQAEVNKLKTGGADNHVLTEAEKILIDLSDMVWFGDPTLNVPGPEGDFSNTPKACKEAGVAMHQFGTDDEKFKKYHFQNIPHGYICYVGEKKPRGDLHGSAGVINVPNLINALITLLTLRGVNLHTGDSVDSIRVLDEDENKHGIEVITTNGVVYRTRKLIITAGCWTNDLLNSFEMRLNLQTYQYISAYYKKKNPADEYPMWISFDNSPSKKHPEAIDYYYGFPSEARNPEYVRVCPLTQMEIMSHPPVDRDPADGHQLETLDAWVNKYMVGLDTKNRQDVTTCLMSVTPDSNFVIDNLPKTIKGYKNIAVTTAGWAMKFVPMFGAILVDLVTKQSTDYLSPALRSGKKDGLGIPDNYEDRNGLLLQAPGIYRKPPAANNQPARRAAGRLHREDGTPSAEAPVVPEDAFTKLDDDAFVSSDLDSIQARRFKHRVPFR